MRLTFRLEPYLPKLVWLMQVRPEDESSLTLYAVVVMMSWWAQA